MPSCASHRAGLSAASSIPEPAEGRWGQAHLSDQPRLTTVRSRLALPTLV